MRKLRVFKYIKDKDLYIELSSLNDYGDIEEKTTILLTSDEYLSYLRLKCEINDGNSSYSNL